MTATFTKAVLKTGVYHSPSGEIPVTSDRLRHWESQVKNIQNAGYIIPMHWDHASLSNLEDLAPIRMSGSQSAEKSVGKLVDFRVAADGNSAELTVQTLTDSATEAASKNTVFVSPVLWDEFKGSDGRVYKDMIGSVDLVDYPVDTSQGPFEPALMSAKPKPCVLCMSAAPSKIYRLSGDSNVDDEEKKPDESTTESEAKAEIDTPEEKAEEATQQPKLQKCIDSLSQLGIVLADDTTVDNFLERLETGLDTYNALQGNQGPAPADEGGNTVVDPGIATMSAKVRQLEERLLSGEKTKLGERLKSCRDSGRCTPDEFNKLSKALAVTRMSLIDNDAIAPTDVSKWIESRESIPQGACWDADEKIKRMSAKPSEPPENQYTSQPAPDVKALQEQSRLMLRR